MNEQSKLALSIIDRNVEGEIIEQRITDGYINATHLCKAAGKQVNDYVRLNSSKDFFDELSIETGIPVSALIEVFKGGNSKLQGSWVHPQIAIHIATWASPKFAVTITKWVFEWMSGNIKGRHRLPYHVRRYMVNRRNIPHTHFSVLNEMMVLLIAPLEDNGYELPEKMIPDISMGRMFSDWIRERFNLDADDFPTYTHSYEDGRKVQARLYPNGYLTEFRKMFSEQWMPNRALKYFETRDEKALPFLNSVLTELPPAMTPPKRTPIDEDSDDRFKE